ncbi:methyl-accepting chemotaxis protein [Pseudodesulfovibrio tunisiensis]|uniref:methyl-accepting chemotaxis protein n=1 Tax=Pseudodesulfovibrio tunisiensis TaxID=463192 RepID=UPI001FB401AA|nr:methyl-accepting chemotaxis protein [Pseudodesulfovibrio tunisiensis]
MRRILFLVGSFFRLNRAARCIWAVNGLVGGVCLGAAAVSGFHVARMEMPHAHWWLGGTVALGLLILFLFTSAALCRYVCRPLEDICTSCRDAASGNYENLPRSNHPAEMGELGKAVGEIIFGVREKIDDAEAMRREAFKESRKATRAVRRAEQESARAEAARGQTLEQASSQIEQVVDMVCGGAGNLLSTVRSAGQGAASQQRKLEEAGESMEQMNIAAADISSNSGEAVAKSSMATEQAVQGARIVKRSIHAISELDALYHSLAENVDRLGRETGNIGSVIEVISDIADQTNLLALNAAIEAARAGDAGRGFAVVADEVRKLAEKTMDATGRVGKIINSIRLVADSNIEGMREAGKAMNDVTSSARESGQALDAIVTLSRDATNRIQGIATASDQQAAASEQMGRVVKVINDVAGNTAEGTQRADECLERLIGNMNELQRIVEDMRQEGVAFRKAA